MKLFQILDHTGHSTIEFTDEQKADAQAKFNQLIAGKHTAATRKTSERDYHVVKDFKQTQDETMFIPQMVGG